MIENQKENEIEKMKDIDRMNIIHVAILSKDKEVIDRIVNFLGKLHFGKIAVIKSIQ